MPGYLIGGKTGSADKPGRGGYRGRGIMASFVAAFPIDRPRYVVLVTLDEPKGDSETYGYSTGGWTAAPTVGQIISRMGPLVGLPPADPGAELWFRSTSGSGGKLIGFGNATSGLSSLYDRQVVLLNNGRLQFGTDGASRRTAETTTAMKNMVGFRNIAVHSYQQLRRPILEAILGNVGTIVCFRVGLDDAEILAKEFSDQFSPADLTNLPNHAIYLRLMIDGAVSPPFSAETVSPSELRF